MMSQPKPCQPTNPANPANLANSATQANPANAADSSAPGGRSPKRRPDPDLVPGGDLRDEVFDRRARRPPAAAREAAADGGGGQAAGAGRTGRARAVRDLYLLTLLSAVDGSLVALAAAGRLDSWGGALTVGLTVVAGAGAWLAAHRAFAGRARSARDYRALAWLGVLTAAATVASAWFGVQVAAAAQLHVLPKAAGVVLLLVAAEVGGLRLPRLPRLPRLSRRPRAGSRSLRVPLPIAVLAAGALLEVAWRWTP